MVQVLKDKADKPALSDSGVQDAAEAILREIEEGGESAVLRLSAKFDGVSFSEPSEVLVAAAEIEAAEHSLPELLKNDIRLAHASIRAFADAQRQSIRDLHVGPGGESSTLWPGLEAGHRMIPVQCAGCYAPGGRFAHLASALMTVTTARAAGVPTVVLCSPPQVDTGRIHPAVLYAAKVSGATHVLTLGGVQGIAAMAFGLFGLPRANVVVGPGNRFVVAAKRALFGRVGIDLIAGPTETCILADASADPVLVATDLVSQAEHGFDSPAVLITTHRPLAESVMKLVPEILADLKKEVPSSAAEVAWRDYGQVLLATDREDMCAASDELASEHLHVQCCSEELDWYHARLLNYGSLFLGEETTVSYGDKCAGPNHVLPTRGAGRYTGGLSVASFLRRLSWQRIVDPVAAREVAEVTARISRLEGMEGHARAADARLRKYISKEAAQAVRARL